MNDTCKKYKATRKSILSTEPSFLRSLFDKMIPDGKFRFITFENDDYTKSSLTFLFRREMPEKVMVSIEHPSDVQSAIREVIRLNTRIEWDEVQIVYPGDRVDNDRPINIALLLDPLRLQINSDGKLEKR